MSDKRDQLCWSCTKSCGSCSWSANFTPVEGWTAEQVPYEGVEFDTTYQITACPEYVKDTRKRKREKGVKAKKPVSCRATCLLTGEVRTYKSINATRKDGFVVNSVFKVLQGCCTQHRGWKFEKLGVNP